MGAVQTSQLETMMVNYSEITISLCTVLFYTVILVEWQMDSLSVPEGVANAIVCASVVNPNLFYTSEVAQLEIFTLSSTAHGKLYKFSINNFRKIPSEIENEDFTPILTTLDFLLVTNNTQCVSIPILDDSILENDEVFALQGLNSTLIISIPPIVQITIEDNDSKLYAIRLSIYILILYIFVLSFFSVAFVGFGASSYSLTEPGMVEVDVTFLGSLSFPVIILVEVNSTTASGTTITNSKFIFVCIRITA